MQGKSYVNIIHLHCFFPRLYDLLMLILQVHSLQVSFLEIMLFISSFLYDITLTYYFTINIRFCKMKVSLPSWKTFKVYNGFVVISVQVIQVKMVFNVSSELHNF